MHRPLQVCLLHHYEVKLSYETSGLRPAFLQVFFALLPLQTCHLYPIVCLDNIFNDITDTSVGFLNPFPNSAIFPIFKLAWPNCLLVILSISVACDNISLTIATRCQNSSFKTSSTHVMSKSWTTFFENKIFSVVIYSLRSSTILTWQNRQYRCYDSNFCLNVAVNTTSRWSAHHYALILLSGPSGHSNFSNQPHSSLKSLFSAHFQYTSRPRVLTTNSTDAHRQQQDAERFCRFTLTTENLSLGLDHKNLLSRRAQTCQHLHLVSTEPKQENHRYAHWTATKRRSAQRTPTCTE